MYCSKCGALNSDEATFCMKCGASLRNATPEPPPTPAALSTTPTVASTSSLTITYAGFWRRFAAYIIDVIILGVAGGLAMAILVPGSFSGVSEAIGRTLLVGGLAFVGQWLYFALLESSSKQATVGKMALSIIVTDMDGRRVTFGKATGRHFSKIISSMIIYIGYIMIAFTGKKQGLHDMIAGTLVINK